MSNGCVPALLVTQKHQVEKKHQHDRVPQGTRLSLSIHRAINRAAVLHRIARNGDGMYPIEAQHVVFATASDSREERTCPGSKPKPAEKHHFSWLLHFKTTRKRQRTGRGLFCRTLVIVWEVEECEAKARGSPLPALAARSGGGCWCWG